MTNIGLVFFNLPRAGLLYETEKKVPTKKLVWGIGDL